MGINYIQPQKSQGCQPAPCVDKFGCPGDRCPDFIIRRHDTKPPFKVAVEDCDGPMDIQGLVIEVNMWAMGKLKKSIGPDDTSFVLADGIGFDQIMVGDIILFDRVRLPEYALVTGFDEDNKIVYIQRGYRSTTPGTWKKGAKLRIFRTMNAPAQTEVVFEDIKQVDGTTLKDQMTGAYLVYEWTSEDTCLPGCYWLEFKLLKMKAVVVFLTGGVWSGPVNQSGNGTFWTGTTRTESSVQLSYNGVEARYELPTSAWTGDFHLSSDNSYYTGIEQNDGSVYLNTTDKTSDPDTSIGPVSNISVISVVLDDTTPPVIPSTDPSQVIDRAEALIDYGCVLGEGVEWARRLPLDGEGFLIKITDSPTREF
jgi:hypothetical protein